MQQPEKHFFEVKKTARYFSFGNPGPHIKHIWIVLHGYGQLADFFIRSFLPITNEETLIIAPEGHSRFYLGENKWKRVGASWMTREERVSEMEDQISMLDQVWEIIGEKKLSLDAKVTLLGFSQGSATAWRWLFKGKIEVDNLIMWAGSGPEDFSPETLDKLSKTKVWAIFGNKDEYISLEEGKMVVEALKIHIPDIQHFIFPDSHRINTEALLRIAKEIKNFT